MILGIFAKTFPGTEPLVVLRAAKAAGYDAVQWNMACSGLPSLPSTIPPATARVVREASEATGVAIAAVSATYNMIHPDGSVREAGRAALDAVAGAARAMGTSLVTLCTGSRDAADQWRHHPNNASPEAWADLLDEMGHALVLSDRHGVTLGIEPEAANVVASAERAEALLAELGHPGVGIVLDPANILEDATDFSGGAGIRDAITRLGPRIVMAHAKDRDAAGRVVPAGTGLVDFSGLIAALRAQGFDGPVVTHGLDAADAPAVAARLRAALA